MSSELFVHSQLGCLFERVHSVMGVQFILSILPTTLRTSQIHFIRIVPPKSSPQLPITKKQVHSVDRPLSHRTSKRAVCLVHTSAQVVNRNQEICSALFLDRPVVLASLLIRLVPRNEITHTSLI